MRNKTLMAMFLTFILICALSAVFSATQSLASLTVWHVDKRGYPYGDFKSITEAIWSSLVQNGHFIIVNPDTYYERPYVNKSLTILALRKGEVIVDGSGKGDIFTIAVANVTLKDFTIRNSGRIYGSAVKTTVDSGGSNISSNVVSNCGWGIYLNCSDSNFVYNNTISNSQWAGIFLECSSNNNISYNNISNTALEGLFLETSSNNTINSNTLSNNKHYGIFLSDSGSNTLSGNIMKNNGYNFGIGGKSLEDFVQTIDSSNKVGTPSLKPIRYLVNEIDTTVPTDSGFVALVNSDNISVNGLGLTTLTKNSHGLLLVNTNNSRIENLTIYENGQVGIYLLNSHQNEITSSTISYHKWNCIQLVTSNNNKISQNTVGPTSFDAAVGISLVRSSGNEIKNNTIQNINRYSVSVINSTNNVVDSNDITEYENMGIYLEGSVNNTLTNNGIKGLQLKSYSGIYLVNSSYNEINMSTISIGWTYGIALRDLSSANKIYHNNFLWNIYHASATSYSNIWDNGYPSGGNYWGGYMDVDKYRGPYQNETGSDGIWDKNYTINDYNIDHYPLVNPIHDVAVKNMTLSKTIVKRGEIVDINVTVENQGAKKETFDVEVYYNTTLLNTTHITLESRNSTIMLFQWNTTIVPPGNYTIKAYATPVEGEIDFADNYINRTVTIKTGAADLNGDGHINIFDLVIVAGAFCSKNATDGMYWHSPPCYLCPHDPRCDADGSGHVNILDLVQYAAAFCTKP